MSAYFVFNYQISNREAYDPYLAEVPKTLEAHGAEILAADFESEVIEGKPPRARQITRRRGLPPGAAL